ncbi:hypothetical protein R1Y80_19275 [Streptomyces sp. JL1001]|uniref:Uncharacterized protein n=1 Tax=Streptomyces sp. JL1001 TaxID=3078227 RepID=A0AAU8KKT6_9ACTN
MPQLPLTSEQSRPSAAAGAPETGKPPSDGRDHFFDNAKYPGYRASS